MLLCSPPARAGELAERQGEVGKREGAKLDWEVEQVRETEGGGVSDSAPACWILSSLPGASLPPFSPLACASKIAYAGPRRPIAEQNAFRGEWEF